MWGKSSLLLAFVALFVITVASPTTSALTDVDSCQTLSTAGEYYILNQSITGPITSDCVVVAADNVTLDCDNFYILNATAPYNGVYSNRINTTIKNCNISVSNPASGIALVGANHSLILNNTLNSNEIGIRLTSTHFTRIENNTGSYNLESLVWLESSSNSNTVFNNTAMNNYFVGIYVGSNNNNTIENNTANNNTYYGIYLLSSTNNRINYNNASLNPGSGGSFGYGIHLDSSSGNNLTGNVANLNAWRGVSLESSTNNIMSNNSAMNCTTLGCAGFYLSASTSNNLVGNRALFSDDASGIQLVSSSNNNNITANNVSFNQGMEDGFGISVSASSGNIIANNTANSNSNAGLRFTSSSDSNIAYGNSFNYNGLYGMAISTSSSNTVFSNVFRSNQAWGIYVVRTTSTNNVISGNHIWDCGSLPGTQACIAIDEANYNIFDGNIINSSADYGIRITSSGSSDHASHNVLKNTNMTNITLASVYMTTASGSQNLNNTFLNFSYNNESVGSGSELIRKWYLDVDVLDYQGNGIPGSNVTLFDKFGSHFDESSTDFGGYSKRFEVTQYSNIGGSVTGYNNYTILASSIMSKSGSVSKIINLTSSMLEVLTMDVYRTLQVALNIDNLANNVYVPGTGVIASASIINSSYSNPTDWYVASYLNNTLRAIVFSYQTPHLISINRTSGYHSIGLSYIAQNSKSFLVFTSGDWRIIDNRIEMIESRDFLNEILPSFAHGLGLGYVIKILLTYSNIDMINDLTMQSGSHDIIAENTGKSGSRRQLRIRSL